MFSMKVFDTLLVANRGEIARRVIRSAKARGLRTVAVYSDADRQAAHVREADTACRIGPTPASESYLDIDAVLAAARDSGAQAIHPGYGFLSERSEFARAVTDAGLVFVGPSADVMDQMGRKDRAREIAVAAGVPVVPDHPVDSADLAEDEFPILVKAAAGGGGKGMRIVERAADLLEALAAARREALNAFGDQRMIAEKYLRRPRHVELQVFADTHGNAVHLFERDCSLQRRHQKIIEETPCPVLNDATREAMCQVALTGARAIGYYSAGTFEFLLGQDQSFYFLEMNTRLQVEHPITEMVTGVDLVKEMIRVADGAPLSISGVERRGVAIEARVYAEDPAQGFLPAPGRIEYLAAAAGPFVRDDSGVGSGSWVSPEFDPLLTKLCAWAPTRAEAIARLRRALGEYVVLGVTTNLDFLDSLLAHPRVVQGDYDTSFVEQHVGELTRAPSTEQAERDALLLAALAARADQVQTRTEAQPTASSSWRDQRHSPTTRYR
ncbi:MAG TPA: biotin carboxylase N-terminal domain-containing protein [Polyangiaceae bacterium]|nr:biotin carboxylase N-terminal domain-containing protein [Polyangiaceae bacterium]